MSVIKITKAKDIVKKNIKKKLDNTIGIENIDINALMTALYSNKETLALQIFSYLKPNKDELEAILMTASYYNNYKVLKKILPSVHDYNIKSNVINTLIINNNISTLYKVISNFSKTEINLIEENTIYSSISIAIIQESLDMVKILLEKGFNINKSDNKGDTPLMVAVSVGNSDITHKLLEQGADANSIADDGFSPLLIALKQKEPNYEIIDLILFAGADYNITINGNSLNELVKPIMDKLSFFKNNSKI